jgi:putative ABC transport system permease protein
MLVRSFSKPVVIANLVAWPLGFLAANVYLTVFMHRIPLTPVPFILSLAITTLVAWVTVAGQALKAARARPAEALSYE